MTGCRLLKKPEIQGAIANLAARAANQPDGKANPLIADAAERREILSRIARASRNPAAAIKAADVLNKMDGLYILKHEVVNPVPLFMMPAGAMPSVSKSQET